MRTCYRRLACHEHMARHRPAPLPLQYNQLGMGPAPVCTPLVLTSYASLTPPLPLDPLQDNQLGTLAYDSEEEDPWKKEPEVTPAPAPGGSSNDKWSAIELGKK